MYGFIFKYEYSASYNHYSLIYISLTIRDINKLYIYNLYIYNYIYIYIHKQLLVI